MSVKPEILVVGTGAVGSTVAGWLAEAGERVTVFDLPPVVEAIRAKGIRLYLGEGRGTVSEHRVNAVSRLEEAPPPGIIILTVKTYSLDRVAALVRAAFSDPPVVLAFQNGVGNQRILPRHFSRVVYGIVGYNAWVDEPGLVGFQKRGPLVLGTPDGACRGLADESAAVLGRAVETVVAERFHDAVYSKMVINLTNSIQALIGHPGRPVGNLSAFQRVLTRLLAEGVEIARANGFREVRIGGMPSWRLIRLSARLPQILTRATFKRNLRKMVVSSMVQDVLRSGQAGTGGVESELEDINGEFIRLADARGLEIPFNRTVYRLCRERFSAASFEPMSIDEVYRAVEAVSGRR